MNVECSGLEREFLRNQLTTLNTLVIDDEFPDLDEDARWYKYRTADQIDSLLKTLLKANRNGIIRREYTNHGLERGMVGGETSRQGERLRASNATHNPANNAINNAINGPITSKRKAEERWAAVVLELSKPEYKGEKSFGSLVAKMKAEMFWISTVSNWLYAFIQTTLSILAFLWNLEIVRLLFTSSTLLAMLLLTVLNGQDSSHHKVVALKVEKVIYNLNQEGPYCDTLRRALTTGILVNLTGASSRQNRWKTNLVSK
jgi:hypothetical protein